MKIKRASVAYDETKFSKEVLEFEKRIVDEMEKAISKGKYECRVTFNPDMPSSIRSKIADELIDLGYSVDMPDFKPVRNPDDAWSSDVVTIRWNNPSR